MARLARAEIFEPAEIVAVHLIGKTVRSFYLMGVDERSGNSSITENAGSKKNSIALQPISE